MARERGPPARASVDFLTDGLSLKAPAFFSPRIERGIFCILGSLRLRAGTSGLLVLDRTTEPVSRVLIVIPGEFDAHCVT